MRFQRGLLLDSSEPVGPLDRHAVPLYEGHEGSRSNSIVESPHAYESNDPDDEDYEPGEEESDGIDEDEDEDDGGVNLNVFLMHSRFL